MITVLTVEEEQETGEPQRPAVVASRAAPQAGGAEYLCRLYLLLALAFFLATMAVAWVY